MNRQLRTTRDSLEHSGSKEVSVQDALDLVGCLDEQMPVRCAFEVSISFNGTFSPSALNYTSLGSPRGGTGLSRPPHRTAPHGDTARTARMRCTQGVYRVYTGVYTVPGTLNPAVFGCFRLNLAVFFGFWASEVLARWSFIFFL